ncbi:homoserine O-acetyltransferase [Cnuella takakiae]|uniref:Homoserine O-acetyltransferase n=1 Tax=Cnuella takakiae TaxID=1302690 RepID=A0A1M5G4M9_9BACT|nr:homoserine O-acetyltransferase [Cnuella takakiae]OLY92330.1 homoserine O-acetyltransferase [Cnuella takakiae]SHF98659.1 homoserine O-acetyltransferase [Cnuella takakiae]
MNVLQHDGPLLLESGQQLSQINIAYHTYGTLKQDKSNVVWICHALTANSDAADWWPGMIGKGLPLDTDRYFIVCANILGSCYGSTGPLSINPDTNQPYFQAFPFLTIRDMVQAHILLRKHLGLEHIHLLIGGSIGGYQALEWSLTEPGRFGRMFLLATSPAESAWGIAVHTAQRMAIEADGTWGQPNADAGAKGLATARAIGMLTYRNYAIMVEKQSDADVAKVDDFKASSYMRYQGEKLVKRFNAYSYYLLSKAMDTHNLARGRANTIEAALQQVTVPTLIIGVTSDILCPVQEQQIMAANIPNATYVEIDSAYGHDGFLVETPTIAGHMLQWLEK